MDLRRLDSFEGMDLAESIDKVKVNGAIIKEHETLGLTDRDIVDLYVQMVLVRTLDERDGG